MRCENGCGRDAVKVLQLCGPCRTERVRANKREMMRRLRDSRKRYVLEPSGLIDAALAVIDRRRRWYRWAA